MYKKSQPPYEGFEPYDILQVCLDGAWSDYASIKDVADARTAKSMCGSSRYRIVSGNRQTVKLSNGSQR